MRSIDNLDDEVINETLIHTELNEYDCDFTMKKL